MSDLALARFADPLHPHNVYNGLTAVSHRSAHQLRSRNSSNTTTTTNKSSNNEEVVNEAMSNLTQDYYGGHHTISEQGSAHIGPVGQHRPAKYHGNFNVRGQAQAHFGPTTEAYAKNIRIQELELLIQLETLKAQNTRGNDKRKGSK